MSEIGSRRSRGDSIASVLSQDKVLSGRARGVSLGAESILSDSVMNVCGCLWTKNARTFFVSLVLFSTITISQTAGALIANSMALLADCASMALDAITYAINLGAECKEETNMQVVRRNQLISSGISFAALAGISIFFFYQGLDSIIAKDWEGSGGGDDVNAWIVLAFALAGIIFDVLSLLPHFIYGLPCLRKDEEGGEVAEKMNLCSALLHVSADLMRSTTTLTESILILQYDINGDEADSYATVIVSGTIVLGAIPPIVDWFRDLSAYMKDYAHHDVELEDSKKEPLVVGS